MLEFSPNTYVLEYRDSAYLCNGTKRVEAPLNLETLEEAVRQCPKLQQVSLEDVPFGDGTPFRCPVNRFCKNFLQNFG